MVSWSNFHNNTSYLLACSLSLSLSQFAFCLGSKDSHLHWRPRGNLLFWCFCETFVCWPLLGKMDSQRAQRNICTSTQREKHFILSVDFLDLGRVKGRNKETNHECGRKGHKERSYFKPLKKKITNIWISFLKKKPKQTERALSVCCSFRSLFITYLLWWWKPPSKEAQSPNENAVSGALPALCPQPRASRGVLACICLITDTCPVLCYSSLSDNLSLSPLTCHSSADGFYSDAKSDTRMRGNRNLNWNNGLRVANFTLT